MASAQQGVEGQLPAAKTTLFTVPARCHVRSFTLNNRSGSTQTCVIYLNFSGTSRVLRRFVLETNEGAELVSDEEFFPLPGGTLIEGESTDATSVDYVILIDN